MVKFYMKMDTFMWDLRLRHYMMKYKKGREVNAMNIQILGKTNALIQRKHNAILKKEILSFSLLI